MAEQVKRVLDAIGLEEQGAAVGLGDGALREGRASPYPPSTGLRTGFEPARSPFETPLWGSSARTESSLRDGPAGLLRVSGRGDGIPLDDEQDEGCDEEEE